MTNFDRVKEFHKKFGVPIAKSPKLLRKKRSALRVELIREEFEELKEAIEDDDIIEVADALADLLYVTYGAALEFGVPIDEVFKEVHRSNLTKLGRDGKPVYRKDGKIIKGPDFEKPKIAKVLKNHN